MFALLKKLFPAQRARVLETAPVAESFASPAPAPAARHHASSPPSARPAPAPAPRPTPARAPAAPGNHGGETLQLSLTAIVPLLPQELLPRINPTTVQEAQVRLNRERITTQLATGSVRISFGELRAGASAGSIVSGADLDGVQITLPLGEVVARLGNAALHRRPGQAQVDVPAEITGPFNKDCAGVAFTAPNKSEVGNPGPLSPRPAITSAWAPAPQTVAPAARTPVAPAPVVSHAPAPVPMTAPVKPAIAPTSSPSPAAPVRPVNAPVGAPVAPKPIGGLPPATSSTTPSLPSFRSQAATSVPAASANPMLRLVPPAAATPASPIEATPVVAAAPSSPAVPAALAVPVRVGDVMERWIEAVKQEITALNLQESKIEIPGEVLEQTLKSGKVSFTWKLIRSWLNPVPAGAPPSAHDGVVLDLPLSIVAPIFLAQRQNATRRKQVVVDASIPDLFAGKDRQASSASIVTAPQTRGASTPAAEASQLAAKPVPKPNDVIKSAAAIAGVEGCLITLHDGLLVAGQVPSQWSSDTLAAFVPQIFGRVNQTMRELKLGDLNNLSFTVGGVPWLIVRLAGTYFAVFGRAGVTLPVTELMPLAAELERKI